MIQPTVVSLKVREKPKGAVPPILHSVRQQAKRRLSDLLRQLFNNTDDALFEMADRSRNDSDQHMYFEAMRQIRLHRKNISSQFIKDFYHSFEAIFQPDEELTERNRDTTADKMSLVQHDELEVSVAIAGIVSKVTSQFSLPIMQLTKRIDYLCQHQNITERLNPLGPEQLSQAFVSAIAPLRIDIKVRIILLKLFERFVMERLGSTYDEANALLTEAGVLSDLKAIMRKSRRRRGSASQSNDRRGESRPRADVVDTAGLATDPNQPAGSAPLGDNPAAASSPQDGFGVIQNLLARVRRNELPADPTAGERSGGGDAGRVEVISTPQLVSVLSDVQTDLHQQAFDLTRAPPVLDLRQVVAANAERVTGRSNAGLAQADDDTVNFIAMLFDYILNDRNLAIPMKALIGRLQIPIVKLGVLDKSFFNTPGHPAKQLLNELSSAGIGWSAAAELKRDALYNKIESIVLRVMNGFKEDPNIFAELVTELREFVNKDNKRHALVEQRVKATETGKAKTHQAKLTVQQLINRKASGIRLPPEVGRFVGNTWSKVLVYACVTQGTESAEWQRDVQTLDDLLWCLQPLDNMIDLQRRDELIPDLLAALGRGMDHLKLAEGTRALLIDMLGDQLTQMSDHDRAFLAEDELPGVDRSFEELEEIVLAAPPGAIKPEHVTPPEPEFVDEINSLHEGMWVELTQASGDRTRCKLAAIVKPGDRYVFVNRRGMKVVEKTRMGLAVELKKKTLTILDESQVFDRALQAVIGNLRQMHLDPPAVPATK